MERAAERNRERDVGSGLPVRGCSGDVDLHIDGALDLSATVVDDVGVDFDVDDKVGAHIHGAVNDHDHVEVCWSAKRAVGGALPLWAPGRRLSCRRQGWRSYPRRGQRP